MREGGGGEDGTGAKAVHGRGEGSDLAEALLRAGSSFGCVCEEYRLRLTVSYRWQRQFFEQGAVVF